jgi:hypothetical protein
MKGSLSVRLWQVERGGCRVRFTIPYFVTKSHFRVLRLLLAATVSLSILSGCANAHWPKFTKWEWPHWFGKKPPKAIPRLYQTVGTVTLVSEDPSFVLIDNGSAPPPVAGTVLVIRNPGAADVQLKVTQIRKPPFVVADIVKGTPRKGDVVLE